MSRVLQMKLMRTKIADHLRSVFSLACGTLVTALLISSYADGQDAVYQWKSSGRAVKVSGKITDVSPAGATIDGKQIPASEIRRLYFSNEPNEVNRARDHMEAGRFSDAIEELATIDASQVSEFVSAEVDFIRAFSNSQISMRGGDIVPQVAGKEVGDFIAAHGDSLQLYPALEQYGKLLFAFGRPDLAAVEFEKLAQCPWPEYQLKGKFQFGKMMLETGKMSDAEAAFDAILSVESNDDLTQTYKQLAKCEKARLAGMQGNADAGLKAINALIDTENSDNKLLFAHLYNAQGAVFEKSGNTKEASRAYLHTELLYSTESEPHAEALFHLAKIWLDLEESDRANQARETLKTRYRNSYWAGKL